MPAKTIPAGTAARPEKRIRFEVVTFIVLSFDEQRSTASRDRALCQVGRVARPDPDAGERRHHGAQWLGDGSGRATRPTWQSARSRLAVDRCSSKDRIMQITTSNLVRFSGLALVPAGLVFAGIQPIHPPDVVESVTTSAWAVITS